MRIFVMMFLSFILIGVNSCYREKSYQLGYAKGHMESQNHCSGKQEIHDVVMLEQLLDKYKLECIKQKQEILDNCPSNSLKNGEL